MKISYIYDKKISKKDAIQLIATTFTGQLGKNMLRLALQFFKITPGSVIASNVTYGFGIACKEYYKSDMRLPIDEFLQIMKLATEQKQSELSKKK
jgi:GTP-binding protein Era